MKNKKGFTLIELLAIIVILAIIAVITVPIILNIIENSKRGAATDSAYGYKDAVNNWYVSKMTEDHDFKINGNYTVADGKLDGTIEIPVSGEKPTSGYLNYSNNVLTTGCLTFGDYAVTFENDGTTNTTKGECAPALTCGVNQHVGTVTRYYVEEEDIASCNSFFHSLFGDNYDDEFCFGNLKMQTEYPVGKINFSEFISLGIEEGEDISSLPFTIKTENVPGCVDNE